jgi:hypothetical protein
MAINALLEREGLDEIFERVVGRLGDEAVNLQAPGLGGECMGVLARIALIGAEFVIVVVACHIFECRRRFVG